MRCEVLLKLIATPPPKLPIMQDFAKIAIFCAKFASFAQYIVF